MSSFTYVPCFVSNPRSGLSLYLSPEAVAEVQQATGLEQPLAFNVVSLSRYYGGPVPGTREERYTVLLSVGGKDFVGRRLSEQTKDPKMRVAFPADGRWNKYPGSGAPVPLFGLAESRLYYRKGERHLELLLPAESAMTPARERQPRAPSAPPAAGTTPPAVFPALPHVSVQLQLPGQPPLDFRLPVADAFGVALDWTRKGYSA